MRVFLRRNVKEAALDRIRWCYDNFGKVVVSWSGGKDSTVLMEITLMVAREYGRLPLEVLFLDQETEWNGVIELARRTKAREEIDFHWFQIPFRLYNASHREWLNCWGVGEDWMREKESDTIHENTFGTDSFLELFDAIRRKHFGGGDVLCFCGMRAAESMARFFSTANGAFHTCCVFGAEGIPLIGDLTEFKRSADERRLNWDLFPIYDWRDADIWKFIYEHDIDYCSLYDRFYLAGVPKKQMRVSSLVHAEAISHDASVRAAEFEPETWAALTKRLSGFGDVRHCGREIYYAMELPQAFRSWREYRDYLLEHLMQDDGAKEILAKRFEKDDRVNREGGLSDRQMTDLRKAQTRLILMGDWHRATDKNNRILRGWHRKIAAENKAKAMTT